MQKNHGKMTEILANGYSSESTHPMNTNMTGFRCFSKSLCPCPLDERSLSIGRVTTIPAIIDNIIVAAYVANRFFVTVSLYFLSNLASFLGSPCPTYIYILFLNSLTLPMLRLLSSKAQSCKDLSPVMLVFIGELSLNILSWVAMCQGLGKFSGMFCIILCWPN